MAALAVSALGRQRHRRPMPLQRDRQHVPPLPAVAGIPNLVQPLVNVVTSVLTACRVDELC